MSARVKFGRADTYALGPLLPRQRKWSARLAPQRLVRPPNAQSTMEGVVSHDSSAKLDVWIDRPRPSNYERAAIALWSGDCESERKRLNVSEPI
jgi:hypothetical protein